MASIDAPAIVITGPTGAGKSEVAVLVAESIDGAVISADSRQIYRHMDIGTAKPGPELRRSVPHYGLDVLDPDERYSAGRFARDARRWIAESRRHGRVPLITGGTGFFIRALLAPLGPEPLFDSRARAALRRQLTQLPVPELARWLRRLDPARAADLEREGGPQRLARSLEVILLSGRSHSWWLAQPPATPALTALTFCLTLPREVLYRRLDGRFDRMLETGLLDEVRRLLIQYGEDAPGLRSVGYSELIAHLKGRLSLAEATEAARRATRRFARRQLTWFRHQLPAGANHLDATQPARRLAARIVEAWRDDAGLAGAGARR
jgi:tRNA dimethylallyltransferase